MSDTQAREDAEASNRTALHSPHPDLVARASQRGVAHRSATRLRCKFHVVAFTPHNWQDADGTRYTSSIGVSLLPVYSPDPTTENYSYSEMTPGGQLQLTITNPAAFEFFKPGMEVYLDLSPARISLGG